MIFLNHHWKFHVVLINHLKISLAISSITLEIPYPQPPVLLVVPTGGKRGGSPLHLPKICSSPTPRTWRNPPPDFSSFPTKSQLPPFFDTQFMLILILIDVQLLVLTESCFQSKWLLLFRFSLPGRPSLVPAKFPIPQNRPKFTPNPYCYLENPAVYFFSGIAHCPASLCKISRKSLEQISAELKSCKIS